MDEGLCSAARDLIDRMEEGIANDDDYLTLRFIANQLCKTHIKD